MAAYNGSRFIKEQIDSIVYQLSIDDELIISDDHSTDDTVDIINSYNILASNSILDFSRFDLTD